MQELGRGSSCEKKHLCLKRRLSTIMEDNRRYSADPWIEKTSDHQFRYSSLMHTMVTEYGIHVRILGEPSVLPSALLMDYDLMLSLKQLDLLLPDLYCMVFFLFFLFGILRQAYQKECKVSLK